MPRKIASIFAAAIAACAVFTVNADGFDGKTLVTNNWFGASFTELTAGTAIAQGDTTGITLGAGSWTSVPASATAQIVADAEVGEGATLLSINAEEGELTFTPAVTTSAGSGALSLAIDDAGLYNRLVAEIKVATP